MGLTVNQLRELRRFESSTAHPFLSLVAGPCGAVVAHSLGKTVVVGSIPTMGSSDFWLMLDWDLAVFVFWTLTSQMSA